jgi:hypothetical protein
MIEATPVKEIADGKESARGRVDVDIGFRVDGARIFLRIHIWDDRWVWIDARRSSKSGWVWEFTREGRFTSPAGARGVVANAEATMDAAFLSADQVPNAMSAIWSKSLATGPRLVP